MTPRRFTVGRARSKFNAQKTEYAGAMYDSAAEARYAAELDLKCRTRQILCWQRQVPIRLEVNGILICKIVADFKITEVDGSITFYEIKGCETPIWRLKRKLLKACHGDIKYLVLPAKSLRPK